MKNANGTGTIYKLKKNLRKPYIAKAPATYGKENDNPKQKVIGYFSTKKEAMIALADYLKTPYNIDTRTIGDTIDQILKHANLSANTEKNYKASYNKHLAPRISNVKLSDVRITTLQPILDELTSTKHTVLSVAKLIANYAFEYEYISRPFVDFLTIPKAEKVQEKLIYTTEEIKMLHERNDDFCKAILVYLYTGFRKDELLMCVKNQVHLDGIPYIQSGSKTEAGKNRIVPIHKTILPIIKTYMEDSRTDYLFPPETRKLLMAGGTRDRNFKKYFNQKHCLHETRHTFRTELDRVESNVTLINKLMGHSGGIGIVTYTHKTIEDLYETIEKINFKVSV